MITLDLTGGTADIVVPFGRASQLAILVKSYSITNHTFVAKIINNAFAEIAEFTITLDTVLNTITCVLPDTEAEKLIMTGVYTWYVEQTSPTVSNSLLLKGNVLVRRYTEIEVTP